MSRNKTEATGRIGIDLGGTKIEGLLIDLEGRELARQRIKTPRHDYQGTLAALRELVERLEADSGVHATVGLGMPGSISPRTSVLAAPIFLPGAASRRSTSSSRSSRSTRSSRTR